ncbi:hypothetical protein CSPB12327_05890 [Campylobacter sp. RM12327]|uniref:hypothetical protein n=1 Tax=Campylobacter sputorum TaxID=206 RepID=UPI000B76ED65|nr:MULTISPECIES: hypothetical protein [Campylobacter]ASM40786.1 hypothetical protein CSPB_1621 [Campylobacter sputorum]MBE7357906.1 hypothetical protein [Campylobacter sp. RM11302]MBF6669667.1 hypothetical protein [Campylobacter sp. RM12327]MBF6674810.1 hypothetical protein [Campylobacter sp. RM13538]MBF6675752.1 hypothetical protein [Campylobacter sp. RM12321]
MLGLKTSNSRLPVDHFISGALFGGITAGAFELQSKNKNTAQIVKNTTKYALEGGIATSLAISASNKIVQKNYLKAGFDIALGIGLLIAIESVFKQKEI